MIVKNNTITTSYENVYQYLSNKEIGIPIFQRFYDWKEKEIVQLKEDLLRIIDEQQNQLYFLDFIYYEEDEKIKLADGQQRLVTLNNLIKAIQDIAEAESVKIDNIELFKITYDIKQNNAKYETHFMHYETAPFKKVYLSFREFIKEHINRINDFVKVIKNNIYVFFKKCANADDAFTIFQQINTGGKPLSKDEVIKTALEQYSKIYDVKININKIRDIRQQIVSYYKYLSKDYDKNFDNMEIITFLKNHVTKDKTTFSDFIDKINMMKKVNDSPIKYVINYINRNTLLDILNISIMNKINIEGANYQKDIIIPLCMASIVLTFNGGSPTTYRYLLNIVIDSIKESKKFDKINQEIIAELKNYPAYTISLSDFTNKLGDKDTSPSIKKALLVLDIIINNTSSTLKIDSINLEHIYPQNPCTEWLQNGWPSTSDDLYKELVNNIGNFIILNEEINKKIKNKYIIDKVNEYNKIIPKDKSLQTSMNTVDFVKFENEGKDYIKKRQEDIAKEIQTKFPLGRVLIK